MIFILKNLEDTMAFGLAFAEALLKHPLKCLLFCGDLGAGKTTLTRAIVENLPQGDQADISSPSFTICNVYQTKPMVFHYDLYRLTQGSCPDELEESLEQKGCLNIVEWSENLPERFSRGAFLQCKIDLLQNGEQRQLNLTAQGQEAEKFLKALASNLASSA